MEQKIQMGNQNVQSSAPKDEDEIDILEILGLLLKHKLFLGICIFLGCIAGFLAANWMHPQYTSDALLQIDVKGN